MTKRLPIDGQRPRDLAHENQYLAVRIATPLELHPRFGRDKVLRMSVLVLLNGSSLNRPWRVKITADRQATSVERNGEGRKSGTAVVPL